MNEPIPLKTCLICGGPLGHPNSIQRGYDDKCARLLEKNSLALFLELKDQAETLRDFKMLFETLGRPLATSACGIALASAEVVLDRIMDKA